MFRKSCENPRPPDASCLSRRAELSLAGEQAPLFHGQLARDDDLDLSLACCEVRSRRHRDLGRADNFVSCPEAGRDLPDHRTPLDILDPLDKDRLVEAGVKGGAPGRDARETVPVKDLLQTACDQRDSLAHRARI